MPLLLQPQDRRQLRPCMPALHRRWGTVVPTRHWQNNPGCSVQKCWAQVQSQRAKHPPTDGLQKGEPHCRDPNCTLDTLKWRILRFTIFFLLLSPLWEMEGVTSCLLKSLINTTAECHQKPWDVNLQSRAGLTAAQGAGSSGHANKWNTN